MKNPKADTHTSDPYTSPAIEDHAELEGEMKGHSRRGGGFSRIPR